MFDKSRLLEQIGWLLCFAVLAWGTGNSDISHLLVGAAVVAALLRASLKPNIIPPAVFKLFKQDGHIAAMEASLKANPEFESAVQYVYSLTPEEFMRFTRTVVEMRYQSDQRGLRHVATLLRKGIK